MYISLHTDVFARQTVGRTGLGLNGHQEATRQGLGAANDIAVGEPPMALDQTGAEGGLKRARR